MISSSAKCRFSVDIGGTFTDLIVWDTATGTIRTNKSSTTPDPSRGVIDVLKKEGLDLETAEMFIHGTTLGLNAIIQKKGARTGLITTRGFRDVLEIGRLDRPNMYDMLYHKPPVIVPRHLRLEVGERLNAKGEVLTPLNTDDVVNAAELFRHYGIDAVAVCLLHAYANPEHEEMVGAVLSEQLPGVHITLSHQISREYHEYERTSSTVLNGYIQPIMDSYLVDVQRSLGENDFRGPILLLRSSGGAMTLREMREAPIHSIMSGPAGGVLGAQYLAQLTGIENIITADAGGTSFDVSMLWQKHPRITTEMLVEGYKLRMPVLDIRSIGAGGGSLGWIDSGGALQVGPESAGAFPGPICYRRGGTQPAVTDAALVLGILDPNHFLGGQMPLDLEGARAGIQELVAEPLGMDAAEAASGMIEIAEVKMAGAIRAISVEKGFDPRDFALLAFGGSGPLFACNIARLSSVNRVVVPVAPGNFSAWGMLVSDLVHDLSRTMVVGLAEVDLGFFERIFEELELQANRALESDGVAESRRRLLRSVDMRYLGQGGHSITVSVPSTAMDGEACRSLEARFHDLHESTYGHRLDDPVEIVNFRLRGIGLVDKPALNKLPAGGPDSRPAIKGERLVYWRAAGSFRPTPIYDRAKLLRGNELIGPAVVEEAASTTVVGIGDEVTVDEWGNLLIKIVP